LLLILPYLGFSQYWDTNGNTVVAGKNKLGTINDFELTFITNNIERMRLTNTGYFGINTTSPTTYLDVNGQVRFRYGAINYGVLFSDANGNATWNLLNLDLTGNTLSIQNQGNTVDLSPYLDNTDSQQLSLLGNDLQISGGNTVSLLSFLDNTDNQTLSLVGTELSILNGNSVDFTNWDTDNTDDFSGNYNDLTNLPTLFDGNWSSLQGTAPEISTFNNDVGYITNPDDADPYPSNEIQDLQLDGNILTITQNGAANPIDLSIYNDNTDNQTLSLAGTELSILNGNSVDFTNWDTNITDDFSGNYNDLTNLPTLFDGDYNSLTNLPTLFDGNYSSLSGIPDFAQVAHTGDYNDLINLPDLFDGNYSSLIGTPTIESLNYWTKLNNNLYYSTGKVGIGISYPQKQLHIHNPKYSMMPADEVSSEQPTTRGTRLTSESSFLLTNKNSGSTATDGLIIRSYNNNAVIYLQEAGSLSLITKKALRFKMESNGNVAIGTLQNNFFVVKETGNVGIKTTDPTATFDINGNIRIRQSAAENYILTSDNTGTGQWKELKLELNENTLSLANHNTSVDLSGFNQTISLTDQSLQLSNDGGSVALNNINYWSKTSNKIYYNSGTVGIGTTNPNQNSKLHIVGNSKAIYLQPIINSEGNGYSDISFYNPSQQQTSWTIRSHVNDPQKGNALMFWSRTGAPLLVLGTDVRVGIGTPNPEFMLDVRGKAHFFEVRVKTESWSDFVFADNYKLPDLVELEKFIKTNRHLPGVPSEAEVIENGVDLGEMNKVLLQKVEELTLIIIEQDKRLRELEENTQNNRGN
ncbi:MAG: hypothetical protein PHH30_04195, partial [Bacteroidales bacterium]|nr:hypothetical protein [Bacteroidales bacterium]